PDRPWYVTAALTLLTYTSTGTLKLPTGGAAASLPLIAPRPVPQMKSRSPACAAFVSVFTLKFGSVKTPGPLPCWLMVKIPNWLATIVMGAGELVRPLNVTVIVPASVGVWVG